MRANRKIVCQNSKISKDIFSDIDECLLWPGRTAITYPSAPTRYQHRPRSTSGQHLPQEYPSLRRASRPASRPAGSHRPSAVGLKNPAASATVCRASCSRSAGEGEREGKEGKKEQRQRIAAPTSQHIPNPARLPILPAFSGHRPGPPLSLQTSSSPAPSAVPAAVAQILLLERKQNPAPKTPNLHGNRGTATCQRLPAMIGGGTLHFQLSRLSTISLQYLHLHTSSPIPIQLGLPFGLTAEQTRR